MRIIDIQAYISEFGQIRRYCGDWPPWMICAHADEVIQHLANDLDSEYVFDGSVARHHSAIIEQGVIFKGPAIIGKDCLVAAYSYLRDGVFLGEGVKIGPHCEIKASFIFPQSAIAHLNYVGNALIGSHVNLEAGVIVANHFNERDSQEISVLVEGEIQETGVVKFGAIIGDHSKIGANAVTTPGTILPKHSIIARLTLVNQLESPQIRQKSVSFLLIKNSGPSAMKLRPHHLLDILGSYGNGRFFEPHPYGHALHTVAQTILSQVDTEIELVIGADEICQPCQHLQPNGVCDDILSQLAHPLSKQIYNDTLDQRLFAYFGLSPGIILSFRNFLEYVNGKVPGLEILCTHPHESQSLRLHGLIQGLQKLGIRMA